MAFRAADYPGFMEVMHPLVRDRVTRLRDVATDRKEFRSLIFEISLLLAYEATRDIPLTTRRVITPLETIEAPVIRGNEPVLLPILRAGLGMVDAFLAVMPGAAIGHIGLGRDETTLEPRRYFERIPPSIQESGVIVLDPMLATGGSASYAVTILKEKEVSRITLVSLIAAPEGVRRVAEDHPDIRIVVASLDRGLNAKGYILPGLGDAGDRMFGTPET